jgi:hypothetical protein
MSSDIVTGLLILLAVVVIFGGLMLAFHLHFVEG